MKPIALIHVTKYGWRGISVARQAVGFAADAVVWIVTPTTEEREVVETSMALAPKGDRISVVLDDLISWPASTSAQCREGHRERKVFKGIETQAREDVEAIEDAKFLEMVDGAIEAIRCQGPEEAKEEGP